MQFFSFIFLFPNLLIQLLLSGPNLPSGQKPLQTLHFRQRFFRIRFRLAGFVNFDLLLLTPSSLYTFVAFFLFFGGFSKPATEMALAHQISLIDLSINEFRDLRDVIDIVANQIVTDEREISIRVVSSVRNIMRRELGTSPLDTPLQENNFLLLQDGLIPVINKAKEYNELFVGMANGPFMLLLKADNPEAFLRCVKEYPRHKVGITWSRQIDNGRLWEIRPEENIGDYRLSFRLPEILAKWIFRIPKGVLDRALEAKQEYFSKITIYRHIEGRDYLYRLEFKLPSTI